MLSQSKRIYTGWLVKMLNMQFSRAVVGTTPSMIFSCPMRYFQFVEIYAVGAMEIGTTGVSVGTGIPMAAGESRGISHLDFRKDDKSIQEGVLEIWAVALVATTAQVSGWRS